MSTTVRYVSPLLWTGTPAQVNVRQALPVVWSQQSVTAYLRKLAAVQWTPVGITGSFREVTGLQWTQDVAPMALRRVAALQWTQDAFFATVRKVAAITYIKQPTQGVLRQITGATLQQSATQGVLRQITGYTMQRSVKPQTVGGLTGLWQLIQANASITVNSSNLSVSAVTADSTQKGANSYVTVAPIGTLANSYSGTYKLYYRRQSIADAFGSAALTWKLGTISSATTIQALLPQINTQYGFSLDPTDVNDGPVAAGATIIQLVAATNSYVYKPGTSVYIGNQPSLASVLSNVYLPGFADANGNGPHSYQGTILADAPYAYYRLNETSGTQAVDLSGNARHGTYTGSFTMAANSLLTRDTSKYPTFPGAKTSYVDITAAMNFCAGTTWTFECWVNVTNYATKGGYVGSSYGPSLIQNTGDTNAATPGVGFELDLLLFGYGQQGWYYWPKDNLSTDTEAAALPTTNTPTHVAWTFNNGTVSIYKNGVLIDTKTGGTVATIRTFLRLGGAAWVGGPLFGSMGEVAVYNKVLTAQQIATHYAAA